MISANMMLFLTTALMIVLAEVIAIVHGLRVRRSIANEKVVQ